MLRSEMARGVLVLFTLLLLLRPSPVGAQITTERVAGGFSRPLALVADPRDPSVFFVVEQGGLIRVLQNQQLLSTPFLDLRAVVSSDGERGLLGLVFEPRGPESPLPPDRAVPRGGATGSAAEVTPPVARPAVPRFSPIPAIGPEQRFFVNFTNRDGDTVIARFRRSPDNPLLADVTSRRDLVWPGGRAIIEQPFANHNGGHLVFGPDGYLYVGLGDGGSAGDPMHRAQDPASLLGKMLRLDVGVGSDNPRGYRVPQDNPFVDNTPISALHEIWSFGLRNPWRYNFDDPSRGGTGGLWVADVGQGAREEINFQPPGIGGLNFGWRLREGTLSFDERRAAAYMPLTGPIHEYGRAEGQSITGGYVYRGTRLDPSFVGRYFYADFVAGRVFSLAVGGTLTAPQASDIREHTTALGGRTQLGMLSSFGVDAAGELYVLNYTAGLVLKVVPQMMLVPSAPQHLRVESSWGGVRLSWQPAAGGVTATHYVVETSGVHGPHALQRIDTGPRASLHLSLASSDQCVRVRGAAQDGVGPPTALLCLPNVR